MPARRHRRTTTATAITLTMTVTAFTAALLTGCDPVAPTSGTSASHPVPPTATPAGGSTGTGGSTGGGTGGTGGGSDATASPAPASVVNGTAHNGLTISNGTRWVVMNGTRVDFGTAVRDLAWSPDGSKAAFIDDSGDLVVSAPDGSGRTVVARNAGGTVWSHPTWQVAPADTRDGIPAKDNLIFAAGSGSAAVLETVPATAVDGSPKELSLNGEPGPNTTQPPTTGNTWPNAAGEHGTSVYENANAEVYIRDDNLRQQGSALTTGTEPAMSPEDDRDYVFVRSVAGHDHLFLGTPGSGSALTVKDLTPNATTDYTEPAFSPDSSTVAARTPGGIVTLRLDGTSPVLVSTYTGLPAYRG